jgi:hypothetical protein
MIRGKEQARRMGKYLEKHGFGREERYIKTQNNTEKGASKNNGKVFRETKVKER